MNHSNFHIPPIGLINLSRVDQIKKIKFLEDEENSNLYNICYFNATIQCLFHFNHFIYQILYLSEEELFKDKQGYLFTATLNL